MSTHATTYTAAADLAQLEFHCEHPHRERGPHRRTFRLPPVANVIGYVDAKNPAELVAAASRLTELAGRWLVETTSNLTDAHAARFTDLIADLDAIASLAASVGDGNAAASVEVSAPTPPPEVPS